MTGKSGKKSQYLAPWSELPQHLLQLVSSRLRFADYLNFRLVCATWRAAAKQHNPCLDYPLFMIPNRRVSNTRLFVSASDGKRYRLMLPEFDNSYFCVGSFHGWLLITNLHLKHLLFFLNPFTGAQIDLPPWDVTKTIYQVALSSAPTEPDCIVLVLSYWYSSLTFLRIGDNEWTKEESSVQDPEQVLFFSGTFYILCHKLHRSDKESSTHSKLAIVNLPHHPFIPSLESHFSYLVESGSEILLVLQGYESDDEDKIADSFCLSFGIIDFIMDRVGTPSGSGLVLGTLFCITPSNKIGL